MIAILHQRMRCIAADSKSRTFLNSHGRSGSVALPRTKLVPAIAARRVPAARPARTATFRADDLKSVGDMFDCYVVVGDGNELLVEKRLYLL